MQTATTPCRRGLLLAIGYAVVALLTACDATAPQTDAPSWSAPSTQSAVPAPPAPTAVNSSSASAERVTVRDRTTVAKGVELRIRSVRAVEVRAQAPGELSGPGIAVTIEIRNNTHEKIDIRGLQVNCLNASGTVCTPNRASSAKALPTMLKSRRQVSGVFVFTVARKDRKAVHVEVDLGPAYRRVEFVGPAR